MADAALRRPEDYERLLSTTLAAWLPERRTAVAAAMAERWLPAYETFSRAEGWGDPAALRQAIDAVWSHVAGTPLGTPERERHDLQERENRPHMDDFDADDALAACVMVHDALQCCADADNIAPATEALLSGFGAVAPAWWIEEDAQPRLWRQAAVKKELGKQLKLLDRIAGVAQFDAATIEALLRSLRSAEYVGVTPPRQKAPRSHTNEALFGYYRSGLEASLKQTRWQPDPDGGHYQFASALLADWMSRYHRRRDAIDGTTGHHEDEPAQRSLVARHLARNATEEGDPGWHPEVREYLGMALRNYPGAGDDARSIDALHGYGPSLRRLWTEAKRRGESDRQALDSIGAWGRHRPAAWDHEDRRKKRKSPEAIAASALGEQLGRSITWDETGDLDYPWATEVDGTHWRVRLNDYPDAVMYTLMIGDDAVGDFHDWPKAWRRA